MGFEQRIKLIEKIEQLRQSRVICYLTSVRPNIGVQMADDAVRVFFDHLLLLEKDQSKSWISSYAVTVERNGTLAPDFALSRVRGQDWCPASL